jgi:hypothetical protein
MTREKETAIRVHDELPAFIVGLPENLFEADLAKSKFVETVSFLKRIVPEIEEARCKIKTVHNKDKKSHYEVDVSIITPHERHTYADSGWDLAKIFDTMSESLKKTFTEEKQKRDTKQRSEYN